jgi:hypothetical protein
MQDGACNPVTNIIAQAATVNLAMPNSGTKSMANKPVHNAAHQKY